ncbi:MAG: hypothetical protein KDK70_20820, partial [Myxococcales bacterium]|nr:hypothetical protein [Myxococcales bacterium]
VERGWVALAATVRSPWAAALEAPRATTSLLTTLGGATALGATLLVVGVLARGAVWGAGTSARAKPNAEPNARAAGSALAEPTPHAPTPLGPSPAPAPARLEPAPIEPTPPVPAPLVPAPIVRDSAPAPAPAPADASPSTPRRPPPNPASPSPTPRAGIEAELALLEHARRALAAHRPAEALASLDEHARRFPRGDLADARMASRVRALCQQGDRRGARAEADRLRRQHPGSALATGLDDPCAETPEP